MIVAYTVIYDDMGELYYAFESQSEQDALSVVVQTAWRREGWTACIFVRDEKGTYTVITCTDKVSDIGKRGQLIEKAWQEIEYQFDPPRGPKRF